MKISPTKKRVKRLMEKHPHLRDDDFRLQATIWQADFLRTGFPNLDEISGRHFLKIYSRGKLTNAESIRRSRADIEEEFPHLRGETYSERQGKRRNETMEDLGYTKH